MLLIVIFGCSFSNDATSASQSARRLAAVVGGSQLTVMVVGALTSAAGAELAGALDAAAGVPDAAAGAGAELDWVAAVEADGLELVEVDLLLLLQPAMATADATASAVTNLWCFIERIPPGLDIPDHDGRLLRLRVAMKVQMPTVARNRSMKSCKITTVE